MKTWQAEHEHSVLALHAPGYQHALLGYIVGDRDYPTIDLEALTGWRWTFVAGGYLRQYAERLRTLYTTGENPEGTHLVCPLCPMSLCGVGNDTVEAVNAARAHVLEHLAAYRPRQGSPVGIVGVAI